MTEIKTALVIGGGVAGPAAALALRKAGIEATVYEAHDSTAEGVGAFIGMAPNGMSALDILGVGEDVRRAAEPVSSMVIHSWTGKRLAELGGTGGEPMLQVVWRSDLCRALYEAAARQGVRIETGKRFVTAEDTGDGVTAHFADGSHAHADILIGADGVRSAVRSLIDPTAPQPGYTGLAGLGGVTAAGTRIGSVSADGSMHMVYGKRAFFGYYGYGDGRVGWFANVPMAEQLPLNAARARGGAAWLAELRELYAGDRSPALEAVRHTDPDELLIVGGMHIMPPAPRWHRGRMVLVGDAAHLPSNSSGQGASLAIEGAVELARCLRDLPAPADAFAAYDRLRRGRVERITAMAQRTNSEKAAGPVARVFRDLLLPVAMKLLAKPERMAWQYGFRIDWDAPVEQAGELVQSST
jgi:2-polyprenyl-6-methoxyphenol hydroxylase-like FAD-dependent oxidoreductase